MVVSNSGRFISLDPAMPRASASARSSFTEHFDTGRMKPPSSTTHCPGPSGTPLTYLHRHKKHAESDTQDCTFLRGGPGTTFTLMLAISAPSARMLGRQRYNTPSSSIATAVGRLPRACIVRRTGGLHHSRWLHGQYITRGCGALLSAPSKYPHRNSRWVSKHGRRRHSQRPPMCTHSSGVLSICASLVR
jgi:hypothetical protein